MVFFNYALRKLNAKIVYYGPGLCGKTTNLQMLHAAAQGDDESLVDALLTRNARIDAVTDEGLSPLHLAAFGGSPAVAKLLLEQAVVENASDAQRLADVSQGSLVLAALANGVVIGVGHDLGAHLINRACCNQVEGMLGRDQRIVFGDQRRRRARPPPRRGVGRPVPIPEAL